MRNHTKWSNKDIDWWIGEMLKDIKPPLDTSYSKGYTEGFKLALQMVRRKLDLDE